MKFFIDNNLPPALARALNELSAPDGFTVVAERDKFPENTPDTDWISALADEGGWVVITRDKLSKGLEREALRRAAVALAEAGRLGRSRGPNTPHRSVPPQRAQNARRGPRLAGAPCAPPSCGQATSQQSRCEPHNGLTLRVQSRSSHTV